MGTKAVGRVDAHLPVRLSFRSDEILKGTRELLLPNRDVALEPRNFFFATYLPISRRNRSMPS